MAKVVVNYEELEQLYNNGEYEQVSDKATSLLEKLDKPDPKLQFIALKALLFSYTPEQIGKGLDVQTQVEENTYKILRDIASTYDDYKEVLRIESEFLSAINLWEEKTIKERLEVLVKNPTEANFKRYYSSMSAFPKMGILTQATLNNLPVVKKAAESEGLELTEFVENNMPKEEHKISEKNQIQLEYNTAQKIFGQAKQFLAHNGDASSDYVQSSLEEIYDKFIVAELLAGYDIPDENNSNNFKSYHIKKLILKAQIIDYYLKAKIYPNGREMYLYQGSSRISKIYELEEIYDRIREKQPNYNPPILPTKESVQSTTQSGATGGCYVATCVYGSYDCSQVWTLRRYRDDILASSWYGRAFIRAYYAVSPTLVKWFGGTDWFKKIFKAKLDKMVSDLQDKGVENTPYVDKKW